jgi:hypothetical protein
MTDIWWDLERLGQRAVGLQELLTDAQDRRPERAEAADRTGAIRVRLGPDGLPRSFAVSTQWRQLLGSRSFGAAATEACQEARRAWQAAWSRALASARGRADAAQPTARPDASAWRPDASAAPRATGHTRQLEVLAEDLLGAFDDILALAGQAGGRPTTVAGTGTNRSKTVAMSLSRQAVLSIDVDGNWVTDQPASLLTEALNQALAAAREDLATAEGAAASSAADARARLDAMVAGALAAMQDPGA